MDTMTAAEIKKALREDIIEEISEYDLDQRYKDMLDEVYGDAEIAGMKYATSRALEELDPTAYRVGFSDWLDGEDDIIEGSDGKYYREI